MKNLFQKFGKLWPEKDHHNVKPLLSQVVYFEFPEDVAVIRQKDLNKKSTVILYKEKNKNLVNFLVNGFEHILCVDREDLKDELLATSLMVVKPRSFALNPLPFFVHNFDPNSNILQRSDNNLTISFLSTTQKDDVFNLLRDFWRQKSSMEALEDICLQIVDEMFTNIFFNAPTLDDGKRPFKEATRNSHITLPQNLKPKIFSCFSNNKVIVGCEDPFGSVIREPILYRLESLYTEAMTAPREHTAGSGLGLKFLIDNSSNFYLYSDKGKKTIFACGLMLKGLKANALANKNIHFVV